MQLQKNGNTALRPNTLSEAMELSKIMANSDLVPRDFKGKSGNVLVAIQMGSEIGLPPMQAIQNIAVINGRPCVWGDAALALVKASGLLETIEESVENNVAVCVVKRKGDPNSVSQTFSKTDAEKARLWNKQGPWQQYPDRMLQMRARSWVLRDAFPDVLKGLNIAEEVQDYDVDIKPEKKIDSFLEEAKKATKYEGRVDTKPSETEPLPLTESGSALEHIERHMTERFEHNSSRAKSWLRAQAVRAAKDNKLDVDMQVIGGVNEAHELPEQVLEYIAWEIKESESVTV